MGLSIPNNTGWAKKWSPALVNFVLAVAYHFFLLNMLKKILTTLDTLFSPTLYTQPQCVFDGCAEGMNFRSSPCLCSLMD